MPVLGEQLYALVHRGALPIYFKSFCMVTKRLLGFLGHLNLDSIEAVTKKDI